MKLARSRRAALELGPERADPGIARREVLQPSDHLEGVGRGVPYPGGAVPVVAVPTTSGTGSEVGRASVITDERDHTKKIIFHPRMLPARVILDPELTVGLPAHLTAAGTPCWPPWWVWPAAGGAAAESGDVCTQRCRAGMLTGRVRRTVAAGFTEPVEESPDSTGHGAG